MEKCWFLQPRCLQQLHLTLSLPFSLSRFYKHWKGISNVYSNKTTVGSCSAGVNWHTFIDMGLFYPIWVFSSNNWLKQCLSSWIRFPWGKTEFLLDEMLVAKVFQRLWIWNWVRLNRHFINSLCKLYLSAKGIDKILCDPEDCADGMLQRASSSGQKKLRSEHMLSYVLVKLWLTSLMRKLARSWWT